jgi:hypothetical protein
MKVKQNYPLGAKYSIIKFPAFIGLIIIIISLTSANFVVTHDGYLYLNSANYLFKTNFELEYQWLREPGYPIILRLVSEFFRIDYAYILIQSLMLSTSFYIFYAVFFYKEKTNILTKIFVIIIVINPYFFGWSATILQVAPITLCLALITLMIHKSQNGISTRDHLYWNIVNIFCWSIALQIGIISFLCHISAILIYSNFKNQMKYLGISLIVFGSIAGTWTNYKNGVLESTQNIQSGWNSNLDNAFTSGEKLLIPLNKDVFKNAFKSSLNLTGLNSPFNREIESEGILKNVFEGCAVWYPTGNTYIAGLIQSSITTYCKAKNLSVVFLGLIPLGTFLWQISNIFLWIAIFQLLFLYRNKHSLILLPTVLLFLSYTVLIFSIDRYILPTYLVPLMLLTKMINSLVQKFSLVLRGNFKS